MLFYSIFVRLCSIVNMYNYAKFCYNVCCVIYHFGTNKDCDVVRNCFI